MFAFSDKKAAETFVVFSTEFFDCPFVDIAAVFRTEGLEVC